MGYRHEIPSQVLKHHRVDFSKWGQLVRARCACGWKSEWMTALHKATDAWHQHTRGVA